LFRVKLTQGTEEDEKYFVSFEDDEVGYVQQKSYGKWESHMVAGKYHFQVRNGNQDFFPSRNSAIAGLFDSYGIIGVDIATELG
jgi:hypothetical protein